MAKVLKLCFSFLSFFWLSAIFSFDESTLGKVDNNPMCYVGGGGVMHYLFLKNTAICSILTEYSARVNNSEMRVLSQILEYPL